MAYTIDYARLTKALDHMARAIFFHHFNTKWDEELYIIPASGRFTPNQPNSKQQNPRLDTLKLGSVDSPKFGQNQAIFYYQFLTDEISRHLQR